MNPDYEVIGETMLAVRDLHKSYGNREVLRGVSFTVSKGQIVSLLGSNGSGKTTTFRCLLNLTDYREGSIRYNGAKTDGRKMGYLPEERSLFFDVEIYRQLKYVGMLKGMSREDADREITYWMDRLKVSQYRHEIPLMLSKGNQQKIQLIMCLLGNPEIIIMDEPWTGLDRDNAGIFQSVLLELKRKNRMILLSSHQYQPIQEYCDRFLYLKNGEIVINKTRGQFQAMPERIVEVEHDADFFFHDELIRKTVTKDRKVSFLMSSDEDAWRIMEKIKGMKAVISIKKRCLNINDVIGELK